MDTFTKPGGGRPAQWEKAGLEWLAQAQDQGGARVCAVVDLTEKELVLERIQEVTPSPADARDFGRGLARTHDADAPAFGAGPEGWDGDGWQGPAGQQLTLPLGAWDSWGAMFAQARIAPLVREASGYSAAERDVFERLCARLEAGDFDDAQGPARVHGDLWVGNVMWSAEGAVLIDPTPYGGHREDDLAALEMFGAPHLEEILAGYQEVHPLPRDWRDRIDLHQLHLMLLHAVLFGGGYADRALAMAEKYL